VINPGARSAMLAGTRLELPYTEFKLLLQLAVHRGNPQSWQDLLRAVWGTTEIIGGRDVVKSTVYRLRSRLSGDSDGTTYVQTIRGAGYVMPDLPPEPEDAGSTPRR
jgi:DNA-binding response OmpR family regulator